MKERRHARRGKKPAGYTQQNLLLFPLGGNHFLSAPNLPASCACPIFSFQALLLVREEVCSHRLADRMPPNEIDAAHAAFRTTANRQLRGLLAHGMEGGAASSCLLDDLLSAPGQGVSTAGGGGGGSSVDLSGQEGVRSSSPSPTVTSSSSSSSSLQYVVAQTGASPAHAAKILQLKEEISRMRRDGHSAVTVIEQLRDRLRAAGEKRQTWAGAEEDAENADALSASGGSGWRDKSGNASKKRRIAEQETGNSFASPFAAGRYENGTGSGSPILPGRFHELPLSPGGASAYNLGESFELEAKPEGKRSREEHTAPLAALKKLKLRAQAESS